MDSPISVAVPARDEEATLTVLLDSLLAQSRPPAEVLVADGGSQDATVALARRHAARGVRVLELGPAFPGRARNAALAAATSDWVALVDAGCVAEVSWLEALADAAGGEARAVFGHYEPMVRSEWEAAQALAIVAPADPETGWRSPSTASLLLHRSAWEAAGRFREDLRAAEDLLFFEALRKAGVHAARAPKAVVRWRLAPSPSAVFRRLRLYSRHHLAAGLFRTWHRRVLAMDLTAAALLLGSVAWPWLAVPLGLGALARLLRTVWVRRRNVQGGAFRPGRLARVTVLLFLADAAAWAGLVDHLMHRRRG